MNDKKVTNNIFCRELSKCVDAIWWHQEQDLRIKDSRNTDRKHEFHINVCLKGKENTKKIFIYKQSNNKKRRYTCSFVQYLADMLKQKMRLIQVCLCKSFYVYSSYWLNWGRKNTKIRSESLKTNRKIQENVQIVKDITHALYSKSHFVDSTM